MYNATNGFCAVPTKITEICSFSRKIPLKNSWKKTLGGRLYIRVSFCTIKPCAFVQHLRIFSKSWNLFGNWPAKQEKNGSEWKEDFRNVNFHKVKAVYDTKLYKINEFAGNLHFSSKNSTPKQRKKDVKWKEFYSLSNLHKVVCVELTNLAWEWELSGTKKTIGESNYFTPLFCTTQQFAARHICALLMILSILLYTFSQK